MLRLKNKIVTLSFGLFLLNTNSFAFNIGNFEIGGDSISSVTENSDTQELDLDGLATSFGGLFDAPSDDSSEGLKLDDMSSGLEEGIGDFTSSLGEGIGDFTSSLGEGIGDLASGIGGGLREVSHTIGGGDILGLSKPVVRDYTLATKLFREALNIENSAEYEEAIANCMGEKVCTNDELDRISNASAEVLAEIERRKASGEMLSAESKAKFNEGLVPFARATASGGVLIAVMINAGSQINNCDADIFSTISCVANAAVLLDILGGLQPMVSGFVDSAGTIYDFSKSNGLEVPEEESAS